MNSILLNLENYQVYISLVSRSAFERRRQYHINGKIRIYHIHVSFICNLAHKEYFNISFFVFFIFFQRTRNSLNVLCSPFFEFVDKWVSLDWNEFIFYNSRTKHFLFRFSSSFNGIKTKINVDWSNVNSHCLKWLLWIQLTVHLFEMMFVELWLQKIKHWISIFNIIIDAHSTNSFANKQY